MVGRHNRLGIKILYNRKQGIFLNKGRHYWWLAASKLLLIQPSSAAAERVFSLLKNSFSAQQTRSYTDYIKASLYLQYNKRAL